MTQFTQKLSFKGTAHIPDTPTLDVAHVSVSYDSLGASFNRSSAAVNALDDVSFQLHIAEQLAVIGPNGAGKSTLLKVVAGLIKPDTGTITMFGHAPDKHICIAYVPQRTAIDWTFPVTVNDVVMMGRTKQIGLFRRPGQRDRDMVRRSLERVKALHLAEKQIGELSGGQQQRIFIARALAQETNLLLMDEPLAGLDNPSQDVLLDILADLRPDDVTVLVATHDLNLVAERFDRVMLLNRQIVAMGVPEMVLNTDNLLAAYGGHINLDRYGPEALAQAPNRLQHELVR